jgi:hypothetical protein
VMKVDESADEKPQDNIRFQLESKKSIRNWG